jgi:hypothetical protein
VNLKRYSTALRKITSTVLLKRGINDGIAVYVPKETILKETAAKIKLSQYFFFDLVQELSDTPRMSLLCKYGQVCLGRAIFFSGLEQCGN